MVRIIHRRCHHRPPDEQHHCLYLRDGRLPEEFTLQWLMTPVTFPGVSAGHSRHCCQVPIASLPAGKAIPRQLHGNSLASGVRYQTVGTQQVP
ncbi:hypothetical protein [Enterobacter ludwigii]|uniref:hypothetical protein n=1 Tax=Enterobacter ludwigii TaxID=299767 RepID=UPI003F729A13